MPTINGPDRAPRFIPWGFFCQLLLTKKTLSFVSSFSRKTNFKISFAQVQIRLIFFDGLILIFQIDQKK
jgi:hypothetical protein